MDVKTALAIAASLAVVLHVIWIMLHPEMD
jgi:hypothetical protein